MQADEMQVSNLVMVVTAKYEGQSGYQETACILFACAAGVNGLCCADQL